MLSSDILSAFTGMCSVEMLDIFYKHVFNSDVLYAFTTMCLEVILDLSPQTYVQ